MATTTDEKERVPTEAGFDKERVSTGGGYDKERIPAGSGYDKEKVTGDFGYDSNGSSAGQDHDFEAGGRPKQGKLSRDLKGRHMQMIAIGMISLACHNYSAEKSPNRGLNWCWLVCRLWERLPLWWSCQRRTCFFFLSLGMGPMLTAPLQLIGFIIIGFMLLCTVQALGELAVLYPVNGAFFTYACRFLDESWYGQLLSEEL